MKYKQMLKIRKIEKGSSGAGQDNAERDGEKGRNERDQGRALSGHDPSWGVKWHNRYLKERIAGLQICPRPGPPRIPSETLEAVKKK